MWPLCSRFQGFHQSAHTTVTPAEPHLRDVSMSDSARSPADSARSPADSVRSPADSARSPADSALYGCQDPEGGCLSPAQTQTNQNN